MDSHSRYNVRWGWILKPDSGERIVEGYIIGVYDNYVGVYIHKFNIELAENEVIGVDKLVAYLTNHYNRDYSIYTTLIHEYLLSAQI